MEDGIRDILVVGAGIHGAGVAQAGAAAGHDVLVLEKAGPAAGTSSRSSKLIHGGLRYLETAQISLVREALHERNLLLRLAPGLVEMVPFHIPIYRETGRRPWQIRTGLWLYRMLEGSGGSERFRAIPREMWGRLDGISTDGLQQVFRYHDARTDDAALTSAVMQSAARLGAELACPAEFVGAVREDEFYRVRYIAAGRQHEVCCRALVNAAGPWVSRVLKGITPRTGVPELEYIQGTHILLPGCPAEGVYYVEAVADRRAVLAIPWKGMTMVGTTETVFTGDPDLVEPQDGEIDYLLETYAHYFPGRTADLLSAFAGVRVLPRGTDSVFRRPREVVLEQDRPDDARMVTIYGGKLTTYRSTALKVMKMLGRSLPVRTGKADTGTIMLEPQQ